MDNRYNIKTGHQESVVSTNSKIFDEVAEKQFQKIVNLTAFSLEMPLVILNWFDIDQYVFYAKPNISNEELTEFVSFCQEDSTISKIENAKSELQFLNGTIKEKLKSPYTSFLIYVIRDEDLNPIGSFFIYNENPISLNNSQKEIWLTLGNQIELLYGLNKRNEELRDSKISLKQQNSLLKSFAGAVSHDLKMPLASIIMTVDILRTKYKNEWDETALDYLERLKQSSLGMSEYITHILDYYETENISSEDYTEEPFNLNEFLEGIIDMLNIDKDCEINLPEKNFDLVCNRSGLEQIFLNLLGNSLKYNDKEKTIIDIEGEEKKKYYCFKITDNGIGISQEKQNKIFDLFSIATERDRYGKKGNGIGLSTVQKIVHKLEGDIKVDSVEGEYTTFIFSIKKQKLKKKAELISDDSK